MNKPKNADELIAEVIKYGSLATMQGVLEMFNIYKGNMNSAQNIEDTKNATSK